ncbi:hypothetical protein ABOC32_16885 [Pseudomonas sp. WOUb67]|uniref:hypothetical protein n=1 Tax=Pseudomonas sp. WOUb67 TaxID=3161136 RepID=UPI003CE6DABD
MGIVQNAIRALENHADEKAKEVKASLQMLDVLAQTKLSEIKRLVEDDIAKSKSDAKSGSPTQIPPGLYMMQDEGTHVMSSSGPSAGIKNAVDSLLHSPEAKWRDALTGLIGTALDTLIGNSSGASSNKKLYLIALDGHAADRDKGIEETYVPVRIDYCLWTYNFESSGISDVATHAIAYYAQTSLLDYSNIPSNLQIDQSLKLIGIPQEYRNAIIEQVEKERGAKRPLNLEKYLKSASPELRASAEKLYLS